MSIIGQKTKSDFVEWDKLLLLTNQLERDGDWKFSLLIKVGMTTGLRISDILSLHWNDIIGKEYLEVTEKKTKKYRKIPIHPELREMVIRIKGKLTGIDNTQFIFMNRWNTKPISPQFVNWKLKEICKRYGVVKDINRIKSHSLRKSFGRRVWENSGRSERGLIMLNEIFNHSNIRITKVYLGIRQQEIFDVYQNL